MTWPPRDHPVWTILGRILVLTLVIVHDAPEHQAHLFHTDWLDLVEGLIAGNLTWKAVRLADNVEE